jgi:eukaryotic-like serine/threonine-protein kinase
MIVLFLLFVVSLLLFLRFSETSLAVILGLLVLIFVLYQTTFSEFHRAMGPLVGAFLLMSSSLFVLGSKPSSQRGGRRMPARGPMSNLPAFLQPLLSRFAPTPRVDTHTSSPKTTTLSGNIGLSIQGYEVFERVGVGGMASVYRARRLDDNKNVALKIPLEKFLADAKFVRRFHREAEVLKRLNHPSVIKVFDHSNQGNHHFIAMEFVEGETLESVMETHKLVFEQSILIIRALADALRYIHSQGIIHRDIKPANVMVALGPEGITGLAPERVKLMDFGIAVGKVLTRLTMTGARVGTPIYMSPEQAKGQKLDSRSDIYSLGLVFYEMTTGQTPFKGSYEVVVHQQVFQMPPPPKQLNLEVPGPLSDLIIRMVEKDPEKRPSLSEIIEELDGGVLEEKVKSDDPSYLLLAVNTKKGVFRRLDLEGNLQSNVGTIQPGSGLPAAPVGLAIDPHGNMYAAIVSYKSGGDVPKMIRKYSPGGEELLAFGAYGLKPGEFLNPVSISISPITQELYVLDAETCIVQRFNIEGEYLGKFGGSGLGKGAFTDPRVVVAGYDDNIYVLDYGNRQVQKFDHEGKYLSRFAFKMSKDDPELRLLDGLGIDSSGAIYISDVPTRKVRRINMEGKAVQSFALDTLPGEDMDKPLQIIVDHEGTVYATRAGLHQIQRFAANGRTLTNLETYEPLSTMVAYVKEGSELTE